MTRKVTALIARTQFGQIMNRAVQNHERFFVERNGEPSVVIMSISDFVKTVAPIPAWLEKSWTSAKRHGLDKLSMSQIDAEIAATRQERRPPIKKAA